jgi:hypothetical protein
MECAGGDGSNLDTRVERFIADRSSSAVTGIRRMGREELVRFVAEKAREMGYSVAIGSEDPSDADIAIATHWGGLEETASKHPGSDILYGQDLCHQVPAVVRLPKRLDSIISKRLNFSL